MEELKIKQIELVPIKARQGLVGFASCVINDQFYIGNIAIHTALNKNEFRLVYPAKTLPNGKTIYYVHPINKETGDAITNAIVDAFKDLLLS